MPDSPNPPKSPTLLPPRKSVELEDPGAHELDTSEAEDDIFSDAQEGRDFHSRPSSPIPTTRVEKVDPFLSANWDVMLILSQVDNRESHGEVPGTAAYNMRTQDAVPDEVEIVPEGVQSRSRTTSQIGRPGSPGGNPIPKMVVEKVDPMSPSHGDLPGTPAHSKRTADAVPDVIRPISSQSSVLIEADDQPGAKSAEIPVPMTVITKVDSKPSHGEVPGTEAYNIRMGDAKPDVIENENDKEGASQLSNSGQTQPRTDSASLIAADGGFGPMGSGGYDKDTYEEPASRKLSQPAVQDAEQAAEEGFGDDFDDFEAGAINEDFGDFNQDIQQSSLPSNSLAKSEPEAPSSQLLPPVDIPFPLLNFDDIDSLDGIIEITSTYLSEIFPSTKDTCPEPAPPISNANSVFLTDRSLSLWSQLVAPPPLQPPNWVRSRIRRLFLVSLGVPVDLDEILPASKQKKLVLPSVHLRSGSPSPPTGHRTGSRVRLRQDNASSTSVDKSGTSAKSKRKKGPTPPPAIDLQATKMLCATTEAALSNMTDEELRVHVKKLDDLTCNASEVLEYWLKRRDSALGDKEAFEGVIENLVKHARRVRK